MMLRKVGTMIEEEDFIKLIHRARSEGAFTNDQGFVNIPGLIKELITTYANGNYTIIKKFK